MKHLIFLPGASGSTEFWSPLGTLLQEYPLQHVIAYPGFGDTATHSDVYDFDSLSRFVLAQIQHDCILIAQSMGGIFVIQAALNKPELVKGIVLIASSGGIDLTRFNTEDWRTAYQNQYLNYPDWFTQVQLDYTPQLTNIQQAVLLLWGDHDPISPVEVGEFLHSTLPNSSFQVILGGNHLFACEKAEETAIHISIF